VDARLLDILVCPLCKSPLVLDRKAQELICRADRLAYPIQDGIPVMLESAARPLHEAVALAEAGEPSLAGATSVSTEP